MAPVRKSRSVNKRFLFPDEASPVKDVKDGDSGSRSNKRKRKVSDMLGPPWSKEDLKRFYEAYRKFGQDWKKVAAAVRNRSAEMVEALYTMNRAYLSLPEGTASVVGLIAMMTDHYSVLEGTDSEQESNDDVGVSRKPVKRPRGKLPANTKGLDRHLSEASRSQPISSAYGCLSLLKKRRPEGNQPRAVGKRTPRIPVRYTHDSAEKYISPSRHGLKSKLDADDDEVAHEVALTLAEASHRGGSPQVSQTPSKRRQTVSASPAGLGERMCSESEMTSAKNVGNEVDDGGCEGSLGSTEGNTSSRSQKPQFAARKGINTLDQPKTRRSYGKKQAVEDAGNNDVDEIKEACSGTEEGQRFSSFDRKVGDSKDAAFIRSPGQVSKRRSKKVLFGGDEGVALDALQALADLSLMMPGSALEAESTVAPKEEKESSIAQSRRQDSLPARGKSKASPSKKKVDQSAVNVLVSESKTLKSGRVSAPYASPMAEMKDPSTGRRKQKSTVPKTSGSEAQIDADANAKQSKELFDHGTIPIPKNRHSPHNASQQYEQLVRLSEHSSSSTEIRKEADESVVSSILAAQAVNISSPTKSRSRRKLSKSQIERNSRDLKNQKAMLNDTSGWSNLEKAVVFKERLSHCLSNYRVRRWCACEWFYSAIDYPWFAKSEFVEYLYHVGLGHVPRLTRVEWGVIRSSLGKPRRFSEQFLKEEKEKLTHYRESVRNHYTELRMGKREGLPADLARPLTVGQHVIAIHPRSREVHNGSILTVDHDRCRVQFDRAELGVEFVKDVDCMPLNPLENMPTSVKRHHVPVDKFYEVLKQFKTNEGAEDRKEEIIKFNSSQKVENADGASYATPAFLTSKLPKQTMEGLVNPSLHEKVVQKEAVSPQRAITFQQSSVSQMQAKEADIRALAELTRALDKKNALVTELKRMNDNVSEDSSLKDVDSFKKQYAAVLVQLNEVLEQVSSALLCLRQRNTYHGNYTLPWQKPVTSLEDRGHLTSSFSCMLSDSQELGSHIYEIVETSRVKARKMVDDVLQVVSSIKEGANVDHKMDDAVNHVNNKLSVDKPAVPVHTFQLNGSLAYQNQLNSCTSNVFIPNHPPESHSNGGAVEGAAQVPSELITNCVATLLMIQKCTERQFPPAEVAKILDFAAANLQPRCTQNLPVYSEIQKCMGIIRSQILALVPT